MSAKSQTFALDDHPAQMGPLLPGEHLLELLLEQAHDLQREARSLAGAGAPSKNLQPLYCVRNRLLND